MLRSAFSLLLLPLASLTLLAAACGSDTADGTNGTGDGSDAAAGGDAGIRFGTDAGSDPVDPDTTPRVGPAPVVLATAGQLAILAKARVSTVPTSKITGDVGLSPAAASYFTGFAPVRAGTYWTSTQVVGGLFAADNDAPTPSNLTTAVGNMEAAYTDAAGRPNPDFTELGSGTIGGLTLTPGLYKWASDVTIPTDITLAGARNDTWIFQISGNLTMAAAKQMILSGGARAKNIVWQVAGFVEIGTTAHVEGIVLSKTAITLGTGSSINGRLFAQTAVDLASATVTAP